MLSAPQLLMASQTRDRLDEGSQSPRSEPLDGAGGGADGAAVWTGGLLCSESKCEAQCSWSSVCRDTLENKTTEKTDHQPEPLIMNYRISPALVSIVSLLYLAQVSTVPVAATVSLVSCVQSSPLSVGPAPPASVFSAPLSSRHSAPLSE